jgi:large subunit ribosomal protein L21
MYAVIKTGGKQYKVSPGDKIKVEQIPADIGAGIQLDQVLAVGSGDQIRIGAPMVGGAAVSATVLAQGRHPKVRIFKMRRRKHYQKHQGHRQNYTELLISEIASDLGIFKAEAKSAGAAPVDGDVPVQSAPGAEDAGAQGPSAE